MLWLDDDQDKVAVWFETRGLFCSECGTVTDDWIDPATGRHRNDPVWEATTVRCYGCAAMAAAADSIPQGQKGVRVMLRRMS